MGQISLCGRDLSVGGSSMIKGLISLTIKERGGTYATGNRKGNGKTLDLPIWWTIGEARMRSHR